MGMKLQRLYLMDNGLGLQKIGISIDPSHRKRQLELTSGLRLTILKSWETLDLPAHLVERGLHTVFARKRQQGEWFKNITVQDIELAGYELRECRHDGFPMSVHVHGED